MCVLCVYACLLCVYERVSLCTCVCRGHICEHMHCEGVCMLYVWGRLRTCMSVRVCVHACAECAVCMCVL